MDKVHLNRKTIEILACLRIYIGITKAKYIIRENILKTCIIWENIPKHGIIWEKIRLGLNPTWEIIHLGFYPFGK